MTTLVLENDPVAMDVSLSARHLVIELADGRRVHVPLEWYPRLLNGTRAERRNWRLLGQGYAIEWPDLDEHVGIEGLLAGRHSGESARSLDRWLGARAERRPKKVRVLGNKPKKKVGKA